MLGRLRMSAEECIEAYVKLSSRVFKKQHTSSITISSKVEARYHSEELRKAIEDLVETKGLERAALLKDTSPHACKVSVVTI